MSEHSGNSNDNRQKWRDCYSRGREGGVGFSNAAFCCQEARICPARWPDTGFSGATAVRWIASACRVGSGFSCGCLCVIRTPPQAPTVPSAAGHRSPGRRAASRQLVERVGARRRPWACNPKRVTMRSIIAVLRREAMIANPPPKFGQCSNLLSQSRVPSRAARRMFCFCVTWQTQYVRDPF